MSCETAHSLPITTGEFLLSSSIDTFPTSTVKSYLKYPDTISQQKCFTFFISPFMLCYVITLFTGVFTMYSSANHHSLLTLSSLLRIVCALVLLAGLWCAIDWANALA